MIACYKQALLSNVSLRERVRTDGPEQQKCHPQAGGFFEVVGAARFELTTSCSQSRRSTRLSYAPSRGAKNAESDDQIKHFFMEMQNDQ